MELAIKKDSLFLPSVVLPLVLNIPAFAEEIQNAFPEMSALIYSLKDNPQCTCRMRFDTLAEESKERIFLLLEIFFNKNIELQQTINTIIDGSGFYDVTGRVFEIQDTDDAFKEFVNFMKENRFSFRNSSLINKDGKLKIYFI